MCGSKRRKWPLRSDDYEASASDCTMKIMVLCQTNLLWRGSNTLKKKRLEDFAASNGGKALLKRAGIENQHKLKLISAVRIGGNRKIHVFERRLAPLPLVFTL